MQIALVYDSRTGTTRSAAEAMADLWRERGDECQVRPVGDAVAADVAAADLIAVGSWTQGLFVVGQHATAASMRFIDSLGPLDGRPALVFGTYKLATGPMLPAMADALERRGADVVGRFAFRGSSPDDAFRRFVAEFDPGSRPPALVADEGTTPWGLLRRLSLRTTSLTHGFQQDRGAERMRAFYRGWAGWYDLSMALDPGYLRGLRRTVELAVRPGDRVLDIGCGTGLATLHAAGFAERVVGLDPSDAMLGRLEAKLRRRSRGNVELRRGRFPDDLAPEERFDSVVSSFALAHVPPGERAAFYREIFARLSDGGRLGLFAAQGEIAPTFERRDELAVNLEQAGFTRITIRDTADVYRIATAVRPTSRAN